MTMIYEHRTYRLKNGSVGAYLRLVGGEGIAIQRRHLDQLVGYFTTEVGPLNEITHIWAYADLADRDRRRAALLADPEWLAFLPKIQVLIEEGTNKILAPAPFSPLA
jgi:hypothetical protein